MYSKDDIINSIINIGVKRTDTLLVHSSMKSVGIVENGADTVLDAFMEYMKDGLLIFPTHTWAQMNDEYNIFNPETEPSCVGILSNIFRKRPNVIRSLHPTHSVAAYGSYAIEYASGEEKWDTPCPRDGCWGKLYDRRAKILFLGCSLRCNTLLHGVEEWNSIPIRLASTCQQLKIVTPEGQIINRPLHRHYNPLCDVSEHYGKMLEPFMCLGIAKKGYIGDAGSILCDAVGMADLTTLFLKRNPDLFIDNNPVPTEWYIKKY
ncbi:AAC(3) family N-acetyltransferase [Lutispora saccharofermentans]|uniref:Aminoglycoside N(3)-acetyltransferase n=1 Tax=Lutispora saccharofermentans TaxID=3024236 RepID=A0ABT1NHJ9_9FIRM|nr:AAC(3) family N-acetyltransferase [Lutispora saccharofermentans]MCQ1530714.1 AAC(3) family N-acetyltransferase [Lutispora saccharofermentans]